MFNQNRTNREFQSGLKHEERRRSRQDDRLRLRRADRENRLQKKRQTLQHRRRNFNPNNPSSQNMQNGQEDPIRAENKQKMLQQLPQYVQGCFSDHPAAQFECTQRIRKLLSIEREPPIQDIINSGVVTRLIQFLDFDNYQRLQFEAAWALTNIASGKAEETAVVVRYGAVPKFVKLISSPCEDVREQVIWALGNIAGDSPELRNLVLSHNAMDALLQVCNVNNINMNTHKQISLQRNATWTLSNFCRGKPQPKWEYTSKAIRALNIMITSDDDEILQDACWAFSYLSDTEASDNGNNNSQGNRQINAIYSSGALARLIQLLEHENPHIQHPALRSIGNVVTGNEEQTQWALNLCVLKKLQSALLGGRQAIKREACWAISNITAGTMTQIEAVITANLIPAMINILKHDKYEVAKEALWALSNATSGGSEAQIKFLVNQGIIGPLCNFLKQAQRNKTKMVTLEALQNILEAGRGIKPRDGAPGDNQFAIFMEEVDGPQILEAVQADESNPEQIFDLAAKLIRDYFDGEEGYLDDGPIMNNNQNGNNNQQSNNNNNSNGGWNVNSTQNNNNNNPFGGNNNNNSNGNNQFGFGIGGNGFNNGWNGNNNNNNNSNNNGNSVQNFNF